MTICRTCMLMEMIGREGKIDDMEENCKKEFGEGKGLWPKYVQFSSVTQSCPTLCYPMDCSMPGFPVLYLLPELTVRMVSSPYLRLLIFFLLILTPACNSSSLAFLMMCSAYRLNKQGGSGQPCGTPFSILNQSVVPYRALTVASWPAYKFLRRQVRWSGIPISLRTFHSLLWFTQSKALAWNRGRYFSGIP